MVEIKIETMENLKFIGLIVLMVVASIVVGYLFIKASEKIEIVNLFDFTPYEGNVTIPEFDNTTHCTYWLHSGEVGFLGYVNGYTYAKNSSLEKLPIVVNIVDIHSHLTLNLQVNYYKTIDNSSILEFYSTKTYIVEVDLIEKESEIK